MRPLSFPRLAAVFFCGAAVLASLRAAEVPAADGKRPAAVGLDVPESLRWTISGDARLVAGHRDNVLLGPIVPSPSDFARLEADLLAWRMPVATTDFLFFINGSETRYTDLPDDAKEERMWLARAEARYDLGEYFRATLLAESLYQEQVFDLSESLASTFRARLKVLGFNAGPTLHWEILRPWWFELKAAWQRTDYQGVNEDNVEPLATVRFGVHLGKRHNLSLAWTGRWKDYDSRNAYTIGGRPIANTDLKVDRHEGELRLESTWGAAGAWKSKLTGGYVRNRDSASGYFDFDRWQGAAQLDYKRGDWSGSLRGKVRASRYLVQIVGEGFDTVPRRLRDTEGELKVARKLGSVFELSAEFSRERSWSNAEYSSYTINTWLVGLEAGW